ncbi:DUF1877 family protein [Streptomyces sp. NPDC058622]|uniref:DUF1877 family protein n=1 Tax=Streptomyces sp. NPDC058622 TaxID=3346562 RepID=UPI00364726EE
MVSRPASTPAQNAAGIGDGRRRGGAARRHPYVRWSAAADTLHRTMYDQLIQDVDPSDLIKAEVYLEIWDSPASLELAGHLFTPLTEFFRGAASARHAMLIWID